MAERGESAGNLDGVLADLRALSGDIESCGVLSKDGELLSSSHEEGVDRERVTAMLGALANLSERTARENGKDHASQVRIKTEGRSEEHTSELQSRQYLVCRLLLEKKK